MRIPSGSTDRKVYFVAVDATDLKTRETGLSSFTVVYSLDGAADVTYTTPTVTELDSSTMPGVYALTLDEGTSLASGHDTEEYCLHITQASMAPVTRVIEIYRPKFTEGQSATMANSCVDADVERFAGTATTASSGRPEVNVSHWLGTAAATPTVAGVPEVDVTHYLGSAAPALVGGRFDVSVGALAGVVQSLADLKDFADEGYDPSTNKVQGVVLTDTVTTYTGNTPQTGDSFARLGAPAGASTAADIAAVKAQTAAIETDTQDIQGRLPAALDASGNIKAQVKGMDANTLTDAATAADFEDKIADKVWDEALAGHLGAGSTGEQLAAAGAAGDPWATLLPGAYGAGTAGKIVGDNLNATVGSRAVAGDAMTLTAAERNAVADALLDRANAVETSLTVRQALRALASTLAGDVTGGPDAPVFKGAGVGTTRVSSVADADGNRTVTLNLS